MALTINTNIASIQSERALAANRGNMETAMQRLSSGKRINSALDDASGLAVANRMRNQIEGLNVAIRNAQDGISLAQTAEGAMEELQNVLLRMRELAVQASNGTYTDTDRSYIAAEFDELTKELRRVSNQAAWDQDIKLIAEGAKPQQVQVGIEAADYISVPLQSLTVEDIGLATKAGVLSSSGAAIDAFDFSTVSKTANPATAPVPADWTSASSTTLLQDVSFVGSPKPNFELRLWNGARDASGNPEGLDSSVNILSVSGATSVKNLIEELKAHPNYDSTTCDLQYSGGQLRVIWKIAGQPNPASKLQVTNSGGAPVNITRTATEAIDDSKDLVAGVSGDLTNYPAHYKQTFDLSGTTFHRDTIPKSAGNFFSVTIGGRVLTADNVTDVADLAAKLKGDSDYNFIRDEAGLGASKVELFQVIDVPAGKLANKNFSGNAISGDRNSVSGGEIYTDTGGKYYRVKSGSTQTTDRIAGNVSGRAITEGRTGGTPAIAEGDIYTDSTGSVRVYAAASAGESTDALLTTVSTGATYITTYDQDLLSDVKAASSGRIQRLVVNFGENSTDRASLYQSTHKATISDIESAINALDRIDSAAKVVNESRARMGASMSRIEYTINNLMNLVENTEEAKSRVLDTDYAEESANLAKAQILAQAGTAMLAQANQSQQYVLNLLRQG